MVSAVAMWGSKLTPARAVVLQQKSNMGVGESFSFLARSTYIRDLATLVRVCLHPVNQRLLCSCHIMRRVRNGLEGLAYFYECLA